ncbi:MAG TPA: LytTR family DNA-binding domain-containing protein [Candidatus Acidoferrales bacterium]|nr:LytTR family DNA-binding domain-containing protein [Candidatus Acidoferrales bacterium]
MRVLIVDDERLARRGVILRLRKFKDVEIVGECADGLSAVEKILELSPDVIFLDIQMPGMDGFEVLRALPKGNLPSVIFLTAYEQHALRAFEVHALDYLLKPVDDERFAAAVNRACQLGDSASKLQMTERILRMLDRDSERYASRFVVRIGSRIQIVHAEDTDWIAAAGDYTELHVRGRSHLLRETMNSLEQKLDPAKFLRIHRSRIVRTDRIVELSAIDNREYLIKLADGSQHRSSRTHADKLARWMNAEKTA